MRVSLREKVVCDHFCLLDNFCLSICECNSVLDNGPTSLRNQRPRALSFWGSRHSRALRGTSKYFCIICINKRAMLAIDVRAYPIGCFSFSAYERPAQYV